MAARNFSSPTPHARILLVDDNAHGLCARKTVLEYPLNFVPAMNEMKSIMKALENTSGGTEFDKSELLRVLGFKPLEDKPDQDMEDFVKTQLGYENARRRR